MGMSGSGWVWVAVDGRATMGVIPTFGAGTLLVRSRGKVLPSNEPVLGESYLSPENPVAPPQEPTPPPSTQSAPNTPQPAATRGFHTSARAGNIYGRKAAGLYSRDIDTDVFEGDIPMADFNKLGTQLYPLFCLSVHEHAWLGGYGIWGKEEYLKRFWNVLDWKKVSDAFELFAPRRTGNTG